MNIHPYRIQCLIIHKIIKGFNLNKKNDFYFRKLTKLPVCLVKLINT